MKVKNPHGRPAAAFLTAVVFPFRGVTLEAGGQASPIHQSVTRPSYQRAVWYMGTPLPKSPNPKRRRSDNNSRRSSSSPSRGRLEVQRANVDLTSEERLQKVLSRLGVSSRRNAEVLITEGRVSVNGRQTRQLGTSVNVWKDRITVDGTVVEVSTQAIWIALHKPRGYVTTVHGSRGLLRFLNETVAERLVAVDAIEEDASGLVLFTNERGAIPDLARPDNPHVKIWSVDCRGLVTRQQLRILNKGVRLKDDVSGAVVQAVGMIH